MGYSRGDAQAGELSRDESPSVRPTAQDLLRHLRDAPPTWAPPLEYPIADDPDEVAGPDSISRGERVMVMDALKLGGFFALLIAVLCIFMLPFN